MPEVRGRTADLGVLAGGIDSDDFWGRGWDKSRPRGCPWLRESYSLPIAAPSLP
jgi:hypothetical protein